MDVYRFFLLLLHSFGFLVRIYFRGKSFEVARAATGFLTKKGKQNLKNKA